MDISNVESDALIENDIMDNDCEYLSVNFYELQISVYLIIF